MSLTKQKYLYMKASATTQKKIYSCPDQYLFNHIFCICADRSETARYLLEEHAPVGVVDDCGQPALTWMISKMAPVAKEALDQLHTCDRANRKQYFYLNHLEPIQPGNKTK